MCVFQLLVLASYGITNTLQRCYYTCIPKKFHLTYGKHQEDDVIPRDVIVSSLDLVNKEEECIICFEVMKDDDILLRVDECRHTFHLTCMKIWNNQYNQTCPLCRAGVGIIF